MFISNIEQKRRDLKAEYMCSLMSKKQVARELGGISVSTVDRMRKDGLISSKSIRGSIMFSIDEIARFLSEG